MKHLWDNATARRLKKAVRKRSPDDWKSSRKRRRAVRSRWTRFANALWLALSTLLVASMICQPYLTDKPAPLPPAIAAGLTALNILGFGILGGMWLRNLTPPDLSPLVNTPAPGRMVYLHLLHQMRRQAALRALGLVGYGFVICLVLGLHSRGLEREVLLNASVACLPLTGSVLAFGVLIEMFRWAVPKVAKVFYIAFGLVLLWELAQLMSRHRIPFPPSVAEVAGMLPHSPLLEWLATDGSPFPTSALLACTGAALLAILLVTQSLRDRQFSFPDEPEDESFHWGAESYVAESFREWKQAVWNDPARYAEYDPEDVDAEEAFPSDAEDQDAPLLIHPSAPENHATPVDPEFRGAMAKRIRALLDHTGFECPLQECILTKPYPPGIMRQSLRVSLWAGFLLPVCAEIASWLPPLYATVLIMASILLILFSLFLMLSPIPRPLPLQSSRWVCLPMDAKVHADNFFRWQRFLFLRRCGVVVAMLTVMALTALAIIGLQHLLALPGQGFVTLDRFFHGHLSGLAICGVLGICLLAIRYLEALRFYRILFEAIRWRGLWKAISTVSAILSVSCGFALFAAGLTLFLFTLGEANTDFHWLFFPVWLLVAEALHQIHCWALLQMARWGRSDWLG